MYTLIKLNPDNKSKERIKRFLKENRKIIKNPKEDFHSTVYYSTKTPVFKRKGILKMINSFFPLVPSPESYYFNIFGERELVLGYRNPDVLKLKDEIILEALRQMIYEWSGGLNDKERSILEKSSRKRDDKIYFDFNPHITLSKFFDKKGLEKLTEFEDEIIFDAF